METVETITEEAGPWSWFGTGEPFGLPTRYLIHSIVCNRISLVSVRNNETALLKINVLALAMVRTDFSPLSILKTSWFHRVSVVTAVVSSIKMTSRFGIR